MVIISSLFFIFGFVTWLNGILIPYLKFACQLSDFQALFVAFAFYISYTIMALPSSWILKKTGLKNGMTAGLWVMAVGTLIFIPAAMIRTYSIFLIGLFLWELGLPSCKRLRILRNHYGAAGKCSPKNKYSWNSK